MKGEILVGLDVGTSKVACVVAQKGADGRVDVVGLGRHASTGLRKGVVVNIESTTEAIRDAVQEAEMMGGVQIRRVVVGISGAHVRGLDSHGVVRTRSNEVSQEDVDRVIEAARAVKIPADQQILHVLPQEFVIDGQEGVRAPVGMSGVRLEARVHIVTAAHSAVENLVKCCRRCGLDVSGIVLEPLASAEAVLSEEEREMGVALVDIGAGTTDIAVLTDGALRFTSVLPVGGDHLTKDLVAGLRTSTKAAEELKIRYGAASPQFVGENEEIEVPSVGGRPPRAMEREALAQLLDPRVEEMLELVREVLERSGYFELLSAGVVLTGGTAKLPGLVEMAEDMLGMQARVGTPRGVGGLADVTGAPEFATGVGLVLFDARTHAHGPRRASGRAPWWKRLWQWFTQEAE